MANKLYLLSCSVSLIHKQELNFLEKFCMKMSWVKSDSSHSNIVKN